MRGVSLAKALFVNTFFRDRTPLTRRFAAPSPGGRGESRFGQASPEMHATHRLHREVAKQLSDGHAEGPADPQRDREARNFRPPL